MKKTKATNVSTRAEDCGTAREDLRAAKVKACEALVYDAVRRIKRIIHSSGLLKQLHVEVEALHNGLELLEGDSDGKAIPDAGDLVCGTLLEVEGNENERIRLHGKITSIDNLDYVGVEFRSLKRVEGDSKVFQTKAEKFMVEEFRIHAAEMEWNPAYDEWNVDL